MHPFEALEAVDTLYEKLTTLADLTGQLDRARVGGTPDMLDLVHLLRLIASTAESAQRQAVPLAVRDGDSWERVATALGVSKQAAWERYGKP